MSWLLVAVCGAVGLYCLTRVRCGSAGDRRLSRIETAMGLGMAAMALPGGEAAALPLVVLFGATAAGALHAAGAGARGGSGARATHVAHATHATHAAHCLHHLIEALAMLYMALVMLTARGAGGHAGHSAAPGGIPAVTGALLVYFAVYALRTGTRLVPLAASAPAEAAATPGAAGTAKAAGTAEAAGRAGTAVAAPADRTAAQLPGTGAACRLALALGSFTMLLTV